VIAALSLTPLVATRSKAQLALSQTLSHPHDNPDGDNEAPYVPSGTVAGLGVTIPAQSGTKGSNIGVNLLHLADPQISHIACPQGWIAQNCLPVAVHTLTVRLRDVSQRPRIGTLVVTVGRLTIGNRLLAGKMLSSLENLSVRLSQISAVVTYMENKWHLPCEMFRHPRRNTQPVNVQPKSRPRLAVDQGPR
jgi:hypothetical protein